MFPLPSSAIPSGPNWCRGRCVRLLSVTSTPIGGGCRKSREVSGHDHKISRSGERVLVSAGLPPRWHMPEQTSAGSVRVVLSGRKYLQRHDNTANLDIAIQLQTCGVTSFVEGQKRRSSTVLTKGPLPFQLRAGCR